MAESDNLPLPSGLHYLKILSDLEKGVEDRCSASLAPYIGKPARCYEAIGAVLVLLDCAASCFWGCRGGDHREELLLGRAVSTSYASLKLMQVGYYDESLSLIRTVGEVANLIALFRVDPAALHQWKSLSEVERRRRFGAVKVRIALEKLPIGIPITEDRYSALSGYAIHVDPNSMPQAHNYQRRSTTVPVFQEAGFLMCINELAIALAFVGLLGPGLLKLSEERRAPIIDASKAMTKHVGSIQATELDRPWFQQLING